MRRALVLLLAFAAVLAFPVGALAAPVLVLGPHGRVTRRDDPYLPPATTPGPQVGSAGSAPTLGGPAPLAKRPSPPKPSPTVGSVLAAMVKSKRITAAQSRTTLGAFNAALAAEKHLTGTRRAELADVTTTVHGIAADGGLWPSRLAAIDATLTANREWWTSGTLLSYGQRVMFTGSLLEWEYYPGQGIQLQALGSFGEANGLWQAGPSEYPALEQLLAEIIPLAANRGGGLTWEYYFEWEGGAPPWTSAMSQATALEALSHAYQATGNPYYLTVAAKAMGVFTRTPAAGGVMVRTQRGVRFVQYTFTPGTAILNAFLQTLIGLHTYATVSGSTLATTLFNEGNAEAQWEVPRYNTGAWSLYQPGEEDDLAYHELVTGFLAQLCTITAAPVYCSTAQAFTADLATLPTLSLLTTHAAAKKPFSLGFRLSKISEVGVTIRRGTTVVFATSASFPYGVDHVAVGKLPAGAYTVTLTATDLAGNYTREPPVALTLTR